MNKITVSLIAAISINECPRRQTNQARIHLGKQMIYSNRVSEGFTILAVLFLLPGAASAQPSEADLTPYEDLPNWSGVWQMNGPTIFDRATVEPPDARAGRPGVREHPPYNVQWEAKYLANIDKVRRDRFPDPLTTCGTSPGFPRAMNLPGAIEFIVRREQVWILTEDGPSITRIFTDGRNHPPADEMWPTYSGESVGEWVGDTLVFETISFKGEGDAILDRTGLVLSEQARITTRLRRIDDSTMEARMIIEDAEALTDAWLVTKEYELLPAGSRMLDVSCAENNRNPVDATGRTLTLDAEGNVLDVEQ